MQTHLTDHWADRIEGPRAEPAAAHVSQDLMRRLHLVEPMAGWGRTPVSAFGIFFLWTGAILHVIALRLARMGES